MRNSLLLTTTFVLCSVLLTPAIQAQGLVFTVHLDLDAQTLLATGSNLGPAPTVVMGNAAGGVDLLNVTNSGASFVVADLLTTTPGNYLVLIVNGPSVGFADVTIGLRGITDGPNGLTALGIGALVNNTTGNRNVAVGSGALSANTTGDRNTATGQQALTNNTEGVRNTATGRTALRSNTTGSNNTATGANALISNTEGNANTATGLDALSGNTTGFSNTATGGGALSANTTGSGNTATGLDALSSNTSGTSNTATGKDALSSTTTGSDNTATGISALISNTTGFDNTATGRDALFANTTAGGNTATGSRALRSNTEGRANTATGANALNFNTTGNSNTATGDGALVNNDTGFSNVATGASALANNTTGTSNTAIGDSALINNSVGDGNVAIGRDAGANADGNNNIYISNLGGAGESDTIRIGDASHVGGAFIAGVQVVAPSSRRFKKDIHDMNQASSALMRLRPVTFRYKKVHADGERPLQYGLIAEEVAEVYPELVVKNDQGQVQTVQYHKLNSMLLNEVQKQHRQIQELTERLAQLEQALSTQQSSRSVAE